jgi:hypothetical protein
MRRDGEMARWQDGKMANWQNWRRQRLCRCAACCARLNCASGRVRLRKSGKKVEEVQSGRGVAQRKPQGYRYGHFALPVPVREANHDWLLCHIGEFVDEANFDDESRVPPMPSTPRPCELRRCQP